MNASADSAELSWLERHEFLIRRLHSLSGLIPVGAYMVVHLLTNASVLDSAATFQRNVYSIHSLGKFLWVVEWGFIFLPLIFHAVIGVVIIRGGVPNTSSYPLPSNIRYTLQRVTGIIAFFFIAWHVFHMHGWFHSEAWLQKVARPLGGAQFRPYNAASTAWYALRGFVPPILYATGVIACVYHLANGIWTMGITWGVWVSEQGQRRAGCVCLAFGIGLSVVGLGALTGFRTLDPQEAVHAEDRMFEARRAAGEIDESQAEHKRLSEQERARLLEAAAQEAPAKPDDPETTGER